MYYKLKEKHRRLLPSLGMNIAFTSFFIFKIYTNVRHDYITLGS